MAVEMKQLPVDPKVWYFIQGYKKALKDDRPKSFDDLNFVPEGLQFFSNLLQNTNNPIATASYGGGIHANEAKHILKYDLWGGRTLSDSPLKCHFFVDENNVPVGFINLGLTGSTPTVTGPNGTQVIEFGVFFADATFVGEQITVIPEAFKEVSEYLYANHETGKLQDYGVIMGTFAKDHPWASKVLLDTKLQKVTKDNCKEIFGSEFPLNDQRFKFSDDGEMQECSHWAKDGNCDTWVYKDMLALNFQDSHTVGDQGPQEEL